MMVPGGLRPKPVGEESEETTNAKSPTQSPQQTSRIPPTPRRPSRPLPPLPPLPFVGKEPLKGIGYRMTSSLDLRGRSDLPTSGKGNAGTFVSQTDVKTMLSTRASSQRELRAVGCRSSCVNAQENGNVENAQDSPVVTANPTYRSFPPARVPSSQLECSGRPAMPPPKPPRTYATTHPIPPRNPNSRASQAVQDKPPLPPRTPVFKLPPTPTAVSQSRPKNALPLPPRSPVWSHAHRDPTRPPLPPGGAKGYPHAPPPLPPSAFARARSPSSSSPSLPPPAARPPSQPLRHLSASSSDLRACAPPTDAPSRVPSPGGPRPSTLPRWASLLFPGTRQSTNKKDSEASPNNQRRREPRGSPDPEERRSRPTTGSSRGLARCPSAPPAGRGPLSAPKPTVTSYTLMVYTDDSTTPPTTSIFLGPPVMRWRWLVNMAEQALMDAGNTAEHGPPVSDMNKAHSRNWMNRVNAGTWNGTQCSSPTGRESMRAARTALNPHYIKAILRLQESYPEFHGDFSFLGFNGLL
ncbi:atrophin-1-like [Penaeus chinensis]|uniref:atrophin-1-like n=1 Tax=Penaeus chinensis TaxID=139456 RepID=UPI001FB5A6D9|nr:atrophin-1-like [Penaeus chinensis]